MIPAVTGALIGAGADLLGGLMSNMFSSAAEGDAFADIKIRSFSLLHSRQTDRRNRCSGIGGQNRI